MIWNPNFYLTSPIFLPIKPAILALTSNKKQWPSLKEYNFLLNEKIVNKNGNPITFVHQELHIAQFEDEYEPRIYKSGEVQTRLNSWHDFFQVIVWKTFPKTKSLLNEIHFNASNIRKRNKIKQRGKAENFVTLFDECGTIFISSDQEMLSLVDNFKWIELFVHHREKFGRSIDCVTFGHAMYEKALTPYIGMTSNSLLVLVDTGYFSLTTTEKNDYLDQRISQNISEIGDLNTTYLNPLPLLGIPNWAENQTTQFYENTFYFRSGKRKRKRESRGPLIK